MSTLKSLIAVLTYRRLNALHTMMTGIETHCPQYQTIIMEDCGQRDTTADYLQQGRVPEPCPELMATEWITEDLLDARYPNARVFLGDRNLGVAGNSNRALKIFMDGDWDHLLLCNDDLHVLGDFVDTYARAHEELGVGMFCFSDFTHHESYKYTVYPMRGWKVKFLSRFTGIMMSVTRKVVEEAGYFDASFGTFGEEHPCPYESPIWMGDYTFKPIGDVRVGDTVIGWSKREQPAKRYGREKGAGKGLYTCDALKKATVLGIKRLHMDVVKVNFESGRSLICAPEHTWLNYHGNKEGNKTYIPAEVGKTLVHVVDPVSTEQEDISYVQGYVHGLVEGDGGLEHGCVVQRTTRLEIRDRLHACLNGLNLKWTTREWGYAADLAKRRRFTPKDSVLHITRIHVDAAYVSWVPETDAAWRGWLAGVYDADGYGVSFGQCPIKHPDVYERIKEGLARFSFECKPQKHQIYLKGGWRELVRFWNLCRPSLSYKLDDAVLLGRFKTPDKVVSIEPLDKQTVYCLKTSTGNYVVSGYASKNCDWTIRARMAGGIKLNGQDMNCLDVESNTLKHQDVETSVLGVDRKVADEEAVAVMQEASRSYAYRHYYRPFCLKMPKMAAGYRGGGIPVNKLLECGTKLVTSLV